MIKNAGQMISDAQTKVNCVDIVTAKALYQDSDNRLIVDVREADSAANSKLEDSVNVSRGLLEMKLPNLCGDPTTLILTHCAGGGRATLAALTLQEMGYQNVHAITAKYDDIKDSFG
jgi:phage shock protein E